MIRIPLVAGEYQRADRNRRIGRIEVEPSQVRRDVPEGSEVTFTIVIDESQLVVARAYVPILDEEFEHAINLESETVPEHGELARGAQAEKRRLEAARRQAAEIGDSRATEVLARVDNERIVQDVEALVDAARVDPGDAATCGSRLLTLRAAVDEVEDALEWPRLVRETEELLPQVREIVMAKGDASHRHSLAIGEAALQQAIAAHDADLLRQRAEDLRILAMLVLEQSGELQILIFEDLRMLGPEMRDQAEAAQLITTGAQAAASGDVSTLRHVNDQLRGMLPTPPPPPDPFSTVRRS
jgi:molecular chaperone DnaK